MNSPTSTVMETENPDEIKKRELKPLYYIVGGGIEKKVCNVLDIFLHIIKVQFKRWIIEKNQVSIFIRSKVIGNFVNGLKRYFA